MGGSRLAGRGSGGSGTVARIVGHLSVAELEARYRAARDLTEARHVQAIWLLARRLGLAQVRPQRGWEALKRIGWSVQAPRPRHARAATPEQRAVFRGGSRRRSPRPRRRTPIGRSRSGPRTSTASA